MDGDRVYVAGGAGMLLCLDVETGAVVWQHDTVAEYDTTVPVWGTASSPLVDGDLLIALVGGEPDALVVAFDKRTGGEVWRAIDVVTEMGYAQPVIYEAGGVRQLIVWHPSGVSSLNPADRRDLTGSRPGRRVLPLPSRPRFAATTTSSSVSSTVAR